MKEKNLIANLIKLSTLSLFFFIKLLMLLFLFIVIYKNYFYVVKN